MNYQTKIVLFLSLLAQFSKEYPADSTLVANFVDLETSQKPHCFRGFCGIKAACRVVELRFKATKGSIQMAYKVGETVVYPHHGAADIISKEKRTIKGEEREYLVLRVHQSDLTVRVPSDNLDLVGVRDVTSQAGLEKVFGVLRMPYVEDPANWSRRFKANTEKLSSGDVIKVAEVVRDLWRRAQKKPLSTGEKSMLARARTQLISEIALAEKTNEVRAEEVLDEVLAS